MKLLYQELRTQLEGNTSANHVRLWNNQISLSEQGEQIPFQTPAVFIDYPSIEWLSVGKGVQTADLTIRFYVVFESFATSENEEDLDVFDLREEVYLALQDFKPTDAGKLTRISENTDITHTNLYVWQMDYVTKYTDTVAFYPRGSVTAEANTLVLDTDLIIDPNTVDGVRTDKDFD